MTHFGGTSGAGPLTAGWAAQLIAHARAVLRSTTGSTAAGLAVGSARTARGPLADGRFSNTELQELLHNVAVQHSGLPAGVAYTAEGFGALDAAAITRAELILDGTALAPTRTADQQADSAARTMRTALFSRCP